MGVVQTYGPTGKRQKSLYFMLHRTIFIKGNIVSSPTRGVRGGGGITVLYPIYLSRELCSMRKAPFVREFFIWLV